MRRLVVAVLVAAAFAPADGRQTAAPQPSQPPVFRGGTTLVQVDAIVSGSEGRPLVDMRASDFDVLDDGQPVTIDRVRFLGAETYSGDATLAPIRTHEDEEREASRDDVHVYAIFLDDYHVQRMGELRVIEPLVALVRHLPPTDLVAVYYPLDSMTDVHFARDREPVLKAIREFKGRRGDYTPTRPVEEEHLRRPRDIELIRRQITISALAGLATHLGGIKQGRKTLLFVSEGFPAPVADLQDVYQAASRSNVAMYPIDPRGMNAGGRGTTRAQMMNFAVGDLEMLRMLAQETGGRPIVYRNDIGREIEQVVCDASAYYLIAYESPHQDDGRFHRVTVRVKRPHAAVFARPGYWSPKRDSSPGAAPQLAPPIPAPVREAVNRLADSLRPNADEPAEAPRRVRMPEESRAAATVGIIAVPTIALARGHIVGDPVIRREFRRTDTIVVRAATTGEPSVTARLLDFQGRPLTDISVTTAVGRCELMLALGSLGAGDYVIELTARTAADQAQQFVAFRLAAR